MFASILQKKETVCEQNTYWLYQLHKIERSCDKIAINVTERLTCHILTDGPGFQSNH